MNSIITISLFYVNNPIVCRENNARLLSVAEWELSGNAQRVRRTVLCWLEVTFVPLPPFVGGAACLKHWHLLHIAR